MSITYYVAVKFQVEGAIAIHSFLSRLKMIEACIKYKQDGYDVICVWTEIGSTDLSLSPKAKLLMNDLAEYLCEHGGAGVELLERVDALLARGHNDK